MAETAKDTAGENRPAILESVGRGGAIALFGLLLLVLEALPVTWFSSAGSETERIVAGVLFVVVLLAVILAGTIIELARQRAAAATTSAARQLDKPAISPAEAERRPMAVADDGSPGGAAPGEPIAAPDRSYVIARPPDGWTIREATLRRQLAEDMGLKDLPDMPFLPPGSVLVLEYGEPTTVTPLPGRTRSNGRRVPLLLSGPLSRALRIMTLSHRQPPFFTQASLYDTLTTQIISLVAEQAASIVSLTPGKLAKSHRDMVEARLTRQLEDVLVGEREVAELRLDTRILAIRGDQQDYVLFISNYRTSGEPGGPADRMDAQVAALLDSFTTVAIADPTAAEHADRQRADEGFDRFIAQNGRAMFVNQFGVAAARLREMTYDTPEQLARALAILRPFRSFAALLPGVFHDYDQLWAAMETAEHGDGTVLRDLLNAAFNRAPEPPNPLDAPLAATPAFTIGGDVSGRSGREHYC